MSINWEKLNFVDAWETFLRLRQEDNLSINDCLKYKEVLTNLLSSNSQPLISNRLSEIEAVKIFLLNQSNLTEEDLELQFMLEMDDEKLSQLQITPVVEIVKMNPFSIEMLDKYEPRALKIYQKEDGTYWIGDQIYEKPSDLPLEFDENPKSHADCTWKKYVNINRAEVYRKTRCFCLPDENLNSSDCRVSTHWVPYFHDGKCVLDKVIVN